MRLVIAFPKEGIVHRQQCFRDRAARKSGQWTVSWTIVTPAAIATIAVACLLGGLGLLGQHFRESAARGFRAPAGLWLVIVGLTLVRVAIVSWQRRTAIVHERLYAGRNFWKWVLAGPVVCYLAGLALGPDPNVAFLFVAGLATWYAAIGVVLTGGADSVSRLGLFCQAQWSTRLGRATFAGLAAFVTAEMAVQVYGYLAGEKLLATYVARLQTLPPGSEWSGRKVNELGYWDEPFAADRRDGVIRIAVVGGGVTLSGTAETNCLEQIERRMPGLEVYNFGLAQGGPREFAAQVTHEAARFHPDLLLLFVSVGDDLTRELPAPGLFDWRRLGLYQVGANAVGLAGCGSCPTAADRREQYLQEIGRQLSVCRTPIDTAMNHRWQKALAHLDDVLNVCHRRKIAVGLVLAPCEFQVSPQLCRSLLRQADWQPQQLDLELPQRRLAMYADQRELPVLDLLPHFRAATASCYCRHDSRWNDQGNSLAAEVVGQWVRRRYANLVGAPATRPDVVLVSGH